MAPVFRRDRTGHVCAADRTRRMRSDAATNLASLLNVMLACTDLASGLVAAVSRPGAKWQAKTWADLAGYAYGDMIGNEVSRRRVERHARTLQSMGLIRSVQWRVHSRDGDVRAAPSKKLVTAKLWELLGLAGQIKKLRRAREQERNKERLQRVTGLNAPARRSQGSRHASNDTALPAVQRANAGAYKPYATAPPPPASPGGGVAARQAIMDLTKLLG